MLVTSSLEEILSPNAIALGNFDGIHRGHQVVLKSVFQSRLYPESLAEEPIYPTVVTFTPHPQEFFTGQKRQLLTPLREKINLLGQLGIKQLILLPFDRELASLSPEKFVEDILINRIKARVISVGEDFCFGHKREGNAQLLYEIASKKQVKVIITQEQKLPINQNNLSRISSSSIRQALREGDLETVEQMLGRKYMLFGNVIEGKKLGRTLGFPTANLEVDLEKLLPRYGVYAVQVEIDGQKEQNFKGVMNIGLRPTVPGEKLSVEVHLLNWTGNLYSRHLGVTLDKFLRPEQKFTSLDALKKQIAIDSQQAQIVGC